MKMSVDKPVTQQQEQANPLLPARVARLSSLATSKAHGEDSPYFDGWKEYDANPYHPKCVKSPPLLLSEPPKST